MVISKESPSTQDAEETLGALSGVKVIDLTTARSGPTSVRVLADLGADVIQVARPATIPETGMPSFDRENLNRNKRSVMLDLQSEAGKSAFMRLVADADVVVENYRPDVKHRLGIDYETLSAVNPRLIYGSISGFGQTGPYSNRPGLDQIVQGMGGLMSITGEPGTGPWRVGIAISDLCSGIFLAQGIITALYEREKSGKGQWVQTSLLEAMIAMLDFQATRWLIAGEVPPQAGNDHPTMFPTGVFETKDGMINIAASSDRMWADFVRVLGLPELIDDERFKTTAQRGRNRPELREACDAALRAKTSAEWVELMNAAGVPCGPILTVDEVFADPQVQHLGMAQAVQSPHFGELNLVRSPVTFSRTPNKLRKAAPRPGEQTAEILREHGLSEDEIDALTPKRADPK